MHEVRDRTVDFDSCFVALDRKEGDPSPRSCFNADGTEKKFYRTRAAAWNASGKIGGIATAYECPGGAGFHVGHSVEGIRL